MLDPLDGGAVTGIEFASTLDRLALGRQHIAGTLGATAADSIVTLVTFFDVKLVFVISHRKKPLGVDQPKR
jgi:hypothetical protein